jgi:hypothetical protein
MIAMTVLSLKPARTNLMTAVFVIGVDVDWACATEPSERTSVTTANLKIDFIAIRFVTIRAKVNFRRNLG